MSKAGIQSNRGDGYQTLVAFNWALTVLDDPSYEWIEVDAATLPVDDVVIGRADGSKICCQCKKNQKLHDSWSVADLADELQKAAKLLADNSKASVHFYSRSPFGELGSLREYSTTYSDKTSYESNFGKAHQRTNQSLQTQLTISAPALSTYEFLRRTTFEISHELERMTELLHERLRRLVSNPKAAFDALWTRLDHLGMRTDGHNGQKSAIQHRLTKGDLKAIIHAAGSVLAPSMNLVEVRSSFQGTSSIGRIWCRDIAGETISTPLIAEILTALDSKPSSILLTGQPGSGKTCLMLALQETLEQQATQNFDRFPIFIQSREFADFDTAQERQAQGLQHDWVERTARLAETTHVVVVIDSLDVLSIAREHKVLDYFLAQMDRLSKLSNVTIITACRDFDLQYDRRIARREWGQKFKCQPLDWSRDIGPLLDRQGIDTSKMDETTRQLVKNPRELALYVELAHQGGSFNVVTSQALAQKYLDTLVLSNTALGLAAMQAIEAMATEMLRLRSLSIPSQRLTASDPIRRALLSHNVLQQTQDGKLTFGHQTLLDVLVISDALRQGKTLFAFIQDLPPVPFVRPSIRSFVAQLASGERKTFRSQLRTVLTGQHAFHIRRLVGECLAEQTPCSDDWPLILDLQKHHPEVFQVIYFQATRLEWHHFWIKHLVPLLTQHRDGEGMTRHAYRVSAWRNDDAAGVIDFWKNILEIEWIDQTHLREQLAIEISRMNETHTTLLSPLLKKLMSMPRRKDRDDRFFGKALAQCVSMGGLSDEVLWEYIAGEVSDEDILGYNFDKHLHCDPHEFGDSNNQFLTHRMQSSTNLLNLAITTIEKWGQIRSSRYKSVSKYWSGFLQETSYQNTHSEVRHRHVDSGYVLFKAIEKAVIEHARNNSSWWQQNCQRVCFNAEGSLRYFGILACTATPSNNTELIKNILSNIESLEYGLSFELGELIASSFIYLNHSTQDAIQAAIAEIHKEDLADTRHRSWALRRQVQLILPIPCHLRTPAIQAVIDEVEKADWPISRKPEINSRGGMVAPPFSFEVFLKCKNSTTLSLLKHYHGHLRNSFSEFLIGGEEEVGRQLQEAASRDPNRFMDFLSNYWEYIPKNFRDDIMDGTTTYLAIRHGNLQHHDNWTPIEQVDGTILAQKILNSLENYPDHWNHNRDAAKALRACSHVPLNTETTERLIRLAYKFLDMPEDDPISGESIDLLTLGINMAKGNAAEALIVVATSMLERNTPWPELMSTALIDFTNHPHPAIRAVILQYLPYFKSLAPEIGWKIFDLAMHNPTSGLWKFAERSLYYAYYHEPERVQHWLKLLAATGAGKELKIWGRISALAALSAKIDGDDFINQLKALNSTEAWQGAASIWSHPENYLNHQNHCQNLLEAAISVENPHAAVVARQIRNLFWDATPLVMIPEKLLQRCFHLLADGAEPRYREVHGFDKWLNAMSQYAPQEALAAAEIYLNFVERTKPYLFDHENNLTQLLTHLFAHAEELEESDNGATIRRVVAIQDKLLTFGVNGMNEWLQAAERL